MGQGPSAPSTLDSPTSPQSSSEAVCFIAQLDDLLIANVLRNLSFIDYPSITLACKQWSQVAQSSNIFWKAMFLSEFRFTATVLQYGENPSPSSPIPWKDQFLEYFKDRAKFRERLEGQLRVVPVPNSSSQGGIL